MDIHVDSAAAAFARDRGGVIYIWVSDSGLLHVKEHPPPGADVQRWQVSFVDHAEVRVAESAAIADEWRVTLSRFPRKRLTATSNMTKSPVQNVYGIGW